MTYRPSRRRSRVKSSARRSSRPTRHCDDADFTDGLATRTSTITHHPVRGATETTPNATKKRYRVEAKHPSFLYPSLTLRRNKNNQVTYIYIDRSNWSENGSRN